MRYIVDTCALGWARNESKADETIRALLVAMPAGMTVLVPSWFSLDCQPPLPRFSIALSCAVCGDMYTPLAVLLVLFPGVAYSLALLFLPTLYLSIRAAMPSFGGS